MKFNPNKYEVNLNLKIIDVLNIFEKNRVNICAVTNKKKEFVGIGKPTTFNGSGRLFSDLFDLRCDYWRPLRIRFFL